MTCRRAFSTVAAELLDRVAVALRCATLAYVGLLCTVDHVPTRKSVSWRGSLGRGGEGIRGRPLGALCVLVDDRLGGGSILRGVDAKDDRAGGEYGGAHSLGYTVEWYEGASET